MRVRLSALLLLLLAGCSEHVTAPSAPGPLPTLPAALRLEAVAEGVDRGIRVTCHLDYLIDAVRNGAYYDLNGGGEAMRQALDATGAGAEFWADAGFVGRLVSKADRGIDLVAYNNGEPFKPTGESPFWDEILTFHGQLEVQPGALVATGTWTCRPMGNHGDTFATITGTWTLRQR